MPSVHLKDMISFSFNPDNGEVDTIIPDLKVNPVINYTVKFKITEFLRFFNKFEISPTFETITLKSEILMNNFETTKGESLFEYLQKTHPEFSKTSMYSETYKDIIPKDQLHLYHAIFGGRIIFTAETYENVLEYTMGVAKNIHCSIYKPAE